LLTPWDVSVPAEAPSLDLDGGDQNWDDVLSEIRAQATEASLASGTSKDAGLIFFLHAVQIIVDVLPTILRPFFVLSWNNKYPDQTWDGTTVSGELFWNGSPCDLALPGVLQTMAGSANAIATGDVSARFMRKTRFELDPLTTTSRISSSSITGGKLQ
jgi:hypothetical protein